MSRTSLIAMLVFAAGLGSGYFARSAAGVLQRRTHAADVAAIEKLNPRSRPSMVSVAPRMVRKSSSASPSIFPRLFRNRRPPCAASHKTRKDVRRKSSGKFIVVCRRARLAGPGQRAGAADATMPEHTVFQVQLPAMQSGFCGQLRYSNCERLLPR